MGYSAVADNTGLSSFALAVVGLLPPTSPKSREILQKFELIAVQGHRSWCQSKMHIFVLVINSSFGHI